MDYTHTSFLPDSDPSSLFLNDWYNEPAVGNFGDMPEYEVDYLIDELPPSNDPQPSHSQELPSQDAASGSSWSPEDSNPQLTPGSTPHDIAENVEHSDSVSFAFISNYTPSPTEDFEHVPSISGESSNLSPVSQRATHGSNAAFTSTPQSQGVSDSSNWGSVQQEWPSFNSTSSEQSYPAGSSPYHGLEHVATETTGAFGESLMADLNIPIPFRPLQPTQQPWTTPGLQSYTQGPSWGYLQQPIMTSQDQIPAQFMPNPFDNSLLFSPYEQSRLNTGMTPFGQSYNGQQRPLPSSLAHNATHQHAAPPESSSLLQPQISTSRANLAQSTRLRFPGHPAISAEHSAPLAPRQNPRPIAAHPEHIPTTALPRSAQDAKNRQGGRKKNSHLNPDARDRSSKMRKKGACWRCKLQRDPCPDDGSPCGRCIIGSAKGQQHFFECNRSKLPDFVMDFLPPSYTTMHSKQNIEDCVKDQVRGWDYTRPVEVYLTSGYGHPLRWVLFEFEPATMELLSQYQYLQNVNTRQSERYEKWSPPLGITKLEDSDDCHFKNYLDELMTDEHLEYFPWRCFEEETEIDDFQAAMLALVCKLYQSTRDHELSHLLQKIIRMLIITYIMGHTLTITNETLPMVQSHLRSSYKPANLAPHTSPRLANRQLKFFFHVLRQQIYEDILKWQQATLNSSGGKNTTWLSTFVVMLAFAMVLEEAQRTIQIQADAKSRKRERSYDDAQQEASNACERIDARFELLIGLFQCKYRDKKWGREGSFGPQTPRLRDPVEHNFCSGLRGLLEEKQNHLRSRKDVPFSSQTQCQYTTRLVARFLLPFLELPG